MATTRNRSNTQITVSSVGAINYPVQPAAWGYKTATSSNQTGDGTTVTLIGDGAIFNQGSIYNTSTGVFTAPVTGKYSMRWICTFSSLTAGHTSCLVQAIATSRTITLVKCNPGAMATSGASVSYSGKFYIDMSVGDTIYLTGQVSGSTKTIGIVGSAVRTSMSLYLEC